MAIQQFASDDERSKNVRFAVRPTTGNQRSGDPISAPHSCLPHKAYQSRRLIPVSRGREMTADVFDADRVGNPHNVDFYIWHSLSHGTDVDGMRVARRNLGRYVEPRLGQLQQQTTLARQGKEESLMHVLEVNLVIRFNCTR